MNKRCTLEIKNGNYSKHSIYPFCPVLLVLRKRKKEAMTRQYEDLENRLNHTGFYNFWSIGGKADFYTNGIHLIAITLKKPLTPYIVECILTAAMKFKEQKLEAERNEKKY